MAHKLYWLNPQLQPRKTKGRGTGLFAKKDIKKGDFLIILGGYVLRLEDEQKLPGDLSDNGVQITEELSLCVTRLEEWGGYNFLNHSCDPNAGIKGQIFVVAMKKIKSGDEITIDYAMVLHRAKKAEKYHLECLCGKKKCRKVVTDDDWKNKDLQKKYDGYFQYFIQEKVNKSKK